MIKIVSEGNYELIETKAHHKILYMNHCAYAWIGMDANGEILVLTNPNHRTSEVLAVGRYRVYDVKDEPSLSDQLHLELQVGSGHWQGYLLPTGFPTSLKKRSRIIATHELIQNQEILDTAYLQHHHLKRPSYLEML